MIRSELKGNGKCKSFRNFHMMCQLFGDETDGIIEKLNEMLAA